MIKPDKCSIYNSLTTLHKDELEYMYIKHENPANHDDLHPIFASTYDGPNQTSTPVDVESLGLEGDVLVWYLAQELTANPDAVFHCHVNTVVFLNRHFAWRIWCGKYDRETPDDGRELFKADWIAVRDLIATTMPEAASSWPAYSDSLSYEQGREILFAAIQANS